MGAELCLAHDMGGGGIGGPLSVDMQPYGCFICFICHSHIKGVLIIVHQIGDNFYLSLAHHRSVNYV